MTDWKTMESAPTDRPIVAWCKEPDNCPDCDEKRMCLFHAHAEGMGSAGDGLVVIEWGGSWADGWEDGGASMPDWWFRVGSEFEEAANPALWTDIQAPTE